MSFMRFSLPKVVGIWTCANPDGVTPSVVFELDAENNVKGTLGRHFGHARANKKGNTWTSRVTVFSHGERILCLDFHHMAPEGSAMTDEITDFISCIMWSLYRADEIKKRNTEAASV